jgi:ketosteroid isomerase-like protein
MNDADALREVEHRRLRALVAADFEVALPLHADDFQLITPRGRSLSRTAYFDAIRDGDIRYVAWEPGPIDVRLHGDVASIRYQAHVSFPPIDGQTRELDTWHTDTYERREGRWQVVWSHATRIA